jgi:signal transduction histidine kinase
VKLLRSLRSRVLIGSLLWTAGLLPIAHLIAIAMIFHFPFTRVKHTSDAGWFLVPASIFMAAGLWQLRRSLSPFDRLRARLSAVRAGSERQVDGDYPTEVLPLINDLNALLEQREQAVKRALAQTGDLAHGLKTPLAVLAQEAEHAAAAQQPELAATISQQVERMRRQIEYHLVHARAAVSGADRTARCSIEASAHALCRTLQRLHAERRLTIEVITPAGHATRGRREELDEMLGNLLDNACKWAKSHVRIESIERATEVEILVDDDGPGLPASLRELVLTRGVRADEAAPGSGLGLAIVSELAELHGGSIALGESPLGGLRARLRLPR